MRQTLLIGNYMPHSVYGGLILFLLLVNPLLAYAKKRWAFTGPELAVVVALTLAACAIPGAGFMRYFTNAVMLPQHKARSRPGWLAEGVVRMAPEHMLAGTGVDFREDDILDARGICEGLASGGEGGTLVGPRKRIWEALPAGHRQAIVEAEGQAPLTGRPAPTGVAAGRPEPAAAEGACRRAVVAALNSLLHVRELYNPEVFSGVTLSTEAEKLLARETGIVAPSDGERQPDGRATSEAGAPRPRRATSPEEPDAARPERIVRLDERDVRTLNRFLIESAWPDGIYSHAKRRHDELYSYLSGATGEKKPVSIDKVPWSAWVRPLLFWVPLLIVMSVGLIGLALVVHKQWSEHEQLPYPVAKFVQSLLVGAGGAGGSMLRNPLFLAVTGAVFLFHMFNCANAWWPEHLVKIPTSFDFSSLQDPLNELIPIFGGGVNTWALFTIRFYFSVVGLAFFVAYDVSLSLGIALPLSNIIGGTLGHYGISMGGKGLYSGSPRQTFHIGAYLGTLTMFVYTGRRYYTDVFRRAFLLKSKDEVGAEAVWGARAFIVCAGLFVLYLVAAGIDWQLAVPYTFMAFMLFLVMARILAETGMFFMEPRWYPCAFLMVMLGMRAVGPSTALLMFLVSTMLLVIPREALMPFVVNSLKVLDAQKVRLGRAGVWCGVAVLVVAVPVTLMFQYGAGTHHWDTWGTGAVPRYSFDKTVEIKQRLRAQGNLEEAESVRGFARFTSARPETRSVIGFAVGLVLVLLLAAARLRWTWWPIHPVIMLAFWTYPGVMFWPSFLLGWFIKKTVTKYGGQSLYKRLTPAMFGLVAGDMLGMLAPSIMGAVYYMATGRVLDPYIVMPD